ncbi:MAG TPA: ABC transporter permease [Conexibacter sp.]|nr:ABC transporter permease [Conexibacter sp.]
MRKLSTQLEQVKREAPAGALPLVALWHKARVNRAAVSRLAVYPSLVVIFGVFALALRNRGFLSTLNLLNIASQAAPIAIMAVGAVFVLSAGEIDLSIGAVVAVSALSTASVLQDHGLLLGLAAGAAVGIGTGFLSGALVTRLRVPSFLVTLAMMEIATGVARRIHDLQSVSVTNTAFLRWFGSGQIGQLSGVVVWAAAVAAIGAVVYRHTRFGAHVRAVGDSRRAAASGGINVARVRIAVFTISGATAALAGILYAGRIQAAQYTLGTNDLFTVIAAVIIGGTSLFGGSGSVLGAVVGALLLATLNNGLILFGLNVAEQTIALGLIILAAVIIGLREQGE